MTQSQFIAACDERFIDEGVALENDEVCEALQTRNDAKVIELLDNEF